jgi:hypothetical protein
MAAASSPHPALHPYFRVWILPSCESVPLKSGPRSEKAAVLIVSPCTVDAQPALDQFEPIAPLIMGRNDSAMPCRCGAISAFAPSDSRRPSSYDVDSGDMSSSTLLRLVAWHLADPGIWQTSCARAPRLPRLVQEKRAHWACGGGKLRGAMQQISDCLSGIISLIHGHFLPREQYTPECRKGLGQDVSSADEIGIALMAAGDTSKHLSVAVAPIVLSTNGTCSPTKNGGEGSLDVTPKTRGGLMPPPSREARTTDRHLAQRGVKPRRISHSMERKSCRGAQQ